MRPGKSSCRVLDLARAALCGLQAHEVGVFSPKLLTRMILIAATCRIIPCDEVDRYLTNKQWGVFDDLAAEEDEDDYYFLQVYVAR